MELDLALQYATTAESVTSLSDFWNIRRAGVPAIGWVLFSGVLGIVWPYFALRASFIIPISIIATVEVAILTIGWWGLSPPLVAYGYLVVGLLVFGWFFLRAWRYVRKIG